MSYFLHLLMVQLQYKMISACIYCTCHKIYNFFQSTDMWGNEISKTIKLDLENISVLVKYVFLFSLFIQLIKFITKSSPKSVHVCWIILWSHFSAGSGGGVPAIGCGRGRVEDVPAEAVPLAVTVVVVALACCTDTTATLVLATPGRFPVADSAACCCSSRLRRNAGHRRLERHPRHVACISTAALCRVPLRRVSSCCRAPSLCYKVTYEVYCFSLLILPQL